MPFIPAIVNKESAQVGAPGSHATGQAFGAEIGAAMEQLGGAVKGLGSAFAGQGKEDQARADALTQATSFAGSSFTPEQNQIEIGWSDPSGAGLPETVRDRNMAWINEQYDADIKGGMSTKNAEAVKLKRLQQVPGNVDQAANQATKMGAEHGVLSLKDALDTQKNDVLLHGATSQEEFQKRLELGSGLIDKMPGLTAAQKQEQKINWANDLGHSRFDAMLRSAKTGADVLALKQELNTPYWKGLFTTPELERQALQLDTSAQRWGAIGEDAHINAVRASDGDYATYEKEVKAGLNELNKVPNKDPAVHAADLQNYRSKVASAVFEAQAEKLALTPTPENKAGLLKLQQDIRDPKWSGEMTKEDYKSQTESIQTHIDHIDNELDKIQTKHDNAYNKLTDLRQSEHNVSLKHALDISKEVLLPNDAWNELFAQRAQLLGELTPEEKDTFHTITKNQEYVAKTQGLNQSGFDRVKRETLNGETRFKSIRGPGRAGEGGGGGLAYTAANGVHVEAGIIDRTSVKGMQPRAYQILDGMTEAGPAAGITRLVITAARGGGHKSHSQGTEWDIVGYTADGKRWSNEQRVAIAEGARGAGADRFGLYEGGNGSLHVGYSGPGRPPAYWGAGGLTGGDASRNFREPASQKFLAGGRGGGGAAGRQSGFVASLMHAENASGDPNAENPVMTTSGHAQGYFQITTGTWKDFAAKAGIDLSKYPQAKGSPYAIQAQMAAVIPMGRWAPETLAYLRQQGFKVDEKATFGENVAANGGTMAGGAGAASPIRDIAPAGADASVAQGVTPMNQPVASGGVVAASDAVRGAAIIDSLASAQQTAINKDVVSYYEAQIGYGGQAGQPLPPLQASGAGWAERVKPYGQANDYYETSGDQRKPFKEAELAAYKNLMGSTNTDGKLQLYSNIAKWQPQMQHDAFDQLGSVDPFNAAVGRMAADGQIGMARSAMAGHAGLEALPTGQKAVWQEASDHAFIETMGDSFRGMDPSIVGQKKALYEALYADRYGLRGKYEPEQMETIIEKAENATFDTVNGLRTLVPAGTPAGATERALRGIDYTAVSKTGTPILATDPTFQGQGNLAPPSEWALSNATLIRTADGEYALADDKGQLYATQLKDGSVVPYAALLSAKAITDADKRVAATMAARAATIDSNVQSRTSLGASPQMPTAADDARLDALPMTGGEFETKLTPPEEQAFQTWKSQYAPRDSGADYDLRGAFKAGLTPDPQTGHWPDTFKKPNHPTFSNESKYATGENFKKAGHWEGNKFIPSSAKTTLPKDIDEGLQGMADTYRATLIRTGSSKEYADTQTAEFLQHLRERELARQQGR